MGPVDVIARANDSAKQPVVFINGLWLKPSAWDRWAKVFEDAGYVALQPDWLSPAHAAPATVGLVADYFSSIAQELSSRPAVVGHAFGGLIAQMLAARGLSSATVAIDPAPFRGVLPLHVSALRAASPVLRNPANRDRRILLTPQQFRYAFANAVSPSESEALYRSYVRAAPGMPVFQVACANLNPWTQARVDTLSPRRGPLLIMCGERDHAMPSTVARASYDRQKRNPHAVTELVQLSDRGLSLIIDTGWREVAETVLTFIKRFV